MADAKTIAVCDDEAAIADLVAQLLVGSGFEVRAFYAAADLLAATERETFDLVVLDIMMPGMDGIEVLRSVRADGNRVPVIMLTAKGGVSDKVEGLDAGANDYLVKPFAAKELLARIRAMTRTAGELDANTLAVGNVRLNLSACALEGPEGRERLSNREFQILEMLMRHPGGRFPTERLLLDVWGDEAPEGPGVVWVYISCLRKKLAAVGADVRLSAARNQGYALEEGLGERA